MLFCLYLKTKINELTNLVNDMYCGFEQCVGLLCVPRLNFHVKNEKSQSSFSWYFEEISRKFLKIFLINKMFRKFRLSKY